MGQGGCYEAIPSPVRKINGLWLKLQLFRLHPHPSQAARTNDQKQWAKPTDICFLLSKTNQTCTQQFCIRITIPQNITLKTHEKINIHPFFFFFIILRHTLTLQPSCHRIYCIVEFGLEFIMEHSIASNAQQQSTSPALPSLRITGAEPSILIEFVGLFFLHIEDSNHLLPTQVYRCQFLASMYSLFICLISWKFHDFESFLLF